MLLIEKIKNWLAAQLFCAIDPKQVLKQSKTGVLTIDGEIVGNEEMRSLQNEVKFLTHTRVWKILTETLKEQAEKIMFEKSTSFDDMKTGKMMLYNLNVQQQIIKIIESYKLK